jgi:ubiquinone/menaquinone biosynthesis C-methylase UbiE
MAKKTHDILEVACNFVPFFTVGRRLKRHETYVGIDLFPGSTDEEIAAHERLVKAAAGIGNVSVQRGDGANLSFPDNSFDEVVFANLFGYVPAWSKTPQFASEAARVVRPGGRIDVVETITPHLMPLPLLRDIMHECGLEQINEGGEHDRRQVARLALPTDQLGQAARGVPDYVAFFQPTVHIK